MPALLPLSTYSQDGGGKFSWSGFPLCLLMQRWEHGTLQHSKLVLMSLSQSSLNRTSLHYPIPTVHLSLRSPVLTHQLFRVLPNSWCLAFRVKYDQNYGLWCRLSTVSSTSTGSTVYSYPKNASPSKQLLRKSKILSWIGSEIRD